MAEQAFIQAYKDELKQLTGPDKARINTLSMLAEDNKEHAQAVVTVIEKHLHEVGRFLGRGGAIGEPSRSHSSGNELRRH